MAPVAAAAPMPGPAADAGGYAPPADCLECHAEQATAWKDSDHDWSMREATAASVLGNFDDVTFSEAGVQARFFRRAGQFFVHTEGADGRSADFPIRYTFGYQPLQQYLVAFPGGRLQALTIAWDSRPASAGGQRWFSLYPGQRFRPGDPLHWTGRYQNWNAMCADCHSTGLRKGYDDTRDTFASTWHEQNVGCQACHGPGLGHVQWARAGKLPEAGTDKGQLGLTVDLKALGAADLVEQCGYCHSRRQPTGLGPQPGQSLFQAALPVTLNAELYHADGQILGEVYEYGSFTQSRMYAAGVSCIDCHEPHSTRVRLEGNALCVQCHNAEPVKRFAGLKVRDYSSREHHHHPEGSAGGQCISCHMPATTYMGVDVRHDHSLRIPRPDLAAQSGSPDACSRCHQDQTPEWAARTISAWFDRPSRPEHPGTLLQAVRQGQTDALQKLGQLIGDLAQPAMVRATAAEQLAMLGQPALPSLQRALADDSALVRAHAASGFAGLPPVERVRHLLPLLDDPQRAVRDEALRALAGIALLALPEARRQEYQAALADYEQRLRGNADLPSGRLNLALLLERLGRQQEAMQEYRQALRLDPYFAPARVNLVTLANASLRQDEALQLLREGVALQDMPASDRGHLAYLLALLLAERGERESAVQSLRQAADWLPGNPRIDYNLGLLLLQMQQPEAAQAALQAGLAKAPGDADLLYALIYLHVRAGQSAMARQYWARLSQAAPDDPRLGALRRQLGMP